MREGSKVLPALVAAAAVVGVGLVAVSAAGVPIGMRPPVEADLRHEYRSLDEVAAASTDVALVETSGSRTVPEHDGAVEAVYTRATVVSSDGGPLAAGDVVSIRQERGRYVNLAPVLREGARYLVYLRPFERAHGVPTEDHTVAGGQAVWLVRDGAGVRTTRESPLPRRVVVAGPDGELGVAS